MKNMIHLKRSSIPIDVLEEIITFGEGYKTELKKRLTSAAEVARSLSAFSNTKGGNLFIGISNTGKTVGLLDKYTEVSKIEKALSLLIPKPEISVQVVSINNRELLLVEIKEGDKKPYYVKNGKETEAYIRAGEVNIPATKKTLTAFINGRSDFSKLTKNLNKEERILFDLFDQEKRIPLYQIKNKLNYSERQVKKSLRTLLKLGLIVPALNDRDVYYRTDHT